MSTFTVGPTISKLIRSEEKGLLLHCHKKKPCKHYIHVNNDKSSDLLSVLCLTTGEGSRAESGDVTCSLSTVSGQDRV